MSSEKPLAALLQVISKEPGNISPRMAEMRADLGTAANDISTLQTFDGPAPETINSECSAHPASMRCSVIIHLMRNACAA
jgi:hypothetical protein